MPNCKVLFACGILLNSFVLEWFGVEFKLNFTPQSTLIDTWVSKQGLIALVQRSFDAGWFDGLAGFKLTHVQGLCTCERRR